MRLGVNDIGSNTVHLLIVDAHPGAHPLPGLLAQDRSAAVGEHPVRRGASTRRRPTGSSPSSRSAFEVAEDHGAQDVFAFATSAPREAPNGEGVIDRVRDESGVELEVLSGRDEARMTFLAVRRWFGWSSGRLLVVDIGGGSLELAAGIDEEPDVAISCRWAPAA